MHRLRPFVWPWLEPTPANQMVSRVPARVGGKLEGPSVQGALLVVKFVVIGKS